MSSTLVTLFRPEILCPRNKVIISCWWPVVTLRELLNEVAVALSVELLGGAIVALLDEVVAEFMGAIAELLGGEVYPPTDGAGLQTTSAYRRWVCTVED